jgi:hypothetical protein
VLRLFVALEDGVVEGVHLFQDIRFKILFAALAANAGGDIADDHQMLLPAIVVVDRLLGDFAAAIRAITVKINERPPLVLGSVK